MAGRYRLEERLGGWAGAVIWGAVDEALGRPVTVWVFPPGFGRAGAVVAAARAACQLEDPRLARVFDADEHGGRLYVVTERAQGAHLGELVAAGPLQPDRAAAMVAGAAAALACAHASGLAHLCLRPQSLRCTGGSEVTVTGLGIAAAAAGAQAADPALADTRGLGQLLYAALTGYWPGAETTALPAAPRRGPALPVSASSPPPAAAAPPQVNQPATVTLEVPPAATAASPVTAGQGPRSPAQAPGPATEPETPAPAGPPSALRRDLGTEPTGSPAPPAQPARHARRARSRLKRVLAGTVMVAVVAVLGAGGWLLARPGAGSSGSAATASPPAHRAAPPRAAWHALSPASAHAFDPYGSGQADNSQLAPLAIDHNPATAWHTDWYTTAHFGNLKPGTGLLLDMGQPITLARARIKLGDTPGATLQLRAGTPAATLQDLPVTATAANAGGWVVLHLGKPVHARYLLIWFTKLPPDPSGTFQASIYSIRLKGRP